ncbi:hypothetical protein, partial [Paenibacillus sp. Y412MC10]|uniref:hypothetical protein n=1 Tax=Geobacillus sp. (strain Y412MC10) TaxID=481743 RepID=UPI001C92C06C
GRVGDMGDVQILWETGVGLGVGGNKIEVRVKVEEGAVNRGFVCGVGYVGFVVGGWVGGVGGKWEGKGC